MQVQSIIEAWCEIRTEGIDVVPESMVPLVAVGAEMNAEKELIQMVADETMARQDICVTYHVGTMVLDCVSCSPYRVPIARLAEAQAAIAAMPISPEKVPVT